jgi:drug/metabolite transporter (DMT)-like permease
MFDLAVALQAIEARAVPAGHGLRPSLYGRLFRSRRWLAATALSLAGFPLQLVALLLAPLTVVQPTLALGLLLLLVLGSRMLGERVGPREFVGVGLVVGGVAGLALAAPERSTHDASVTAIAVVLGLLALAGALPFARRSWSAALPVVYSAGIWFAWGSLTAKFLADDLSAHRWLAALGWAVATGLAGVVALLAEMTALQRRPAVQVAPIVFVVQVTVPVLLAPVLVGEHWSATPGGGVVVVLLLAVVAAGSLVLGRSLAVAGLTAGAHELPDRDGLETATAQGGEDPPHLGAAPGAGADLEDHART